MLLRELQKSNKISLGNFYFKRFKRLTPALSTMLVFAVIVSTLLFSPYGLLQVVDKTAIGAIFIISNWVISVSSGGYFDPAAETNPLLHTWSLSVEEQFYLFFPGLLALIWWVTRASQKFKGVLTVAAISSISLISLGLALYALNSAAMTSGFLFGFYSPFTRIWEFGAGALLALFWSTASRIKGRTATLISSLGAIGLIWSFSFINGDMDYPSLITLVPVLSTIALILGGVSENNPTTRVLSWRPLTLVGDWSYSLYLWHWPFIVFALAIWPLSEFAGPIAALIAIIPALISYYFIEQPIRGSKFKTLFSKARTILLVTLIPIIIASLSFWTAEKVLIPKFEAGDFSKVLEGDIGLEEENTFLASNTVPCENKKVLQSSPIYNNQLRCHQSKKDLPVNVVLVGDSHAEHLFSGMVKEFPNLNIAYYIEEGVPFSGSKRSKIVEEEILNTPQIQTVVISLYWAIKDVPVDGLKSFIDSITASGINVIISDDNPGFSFDAFECKYQQGILLGKKCEESSIKFWAKHEEYLAKLELLSLGNPRVHLVEISKLFCDETVCSMRKENNLYFRDLNHLNLDGSSYVVKSLMEKDSIFKQMLSSSSQGK